MRQSHPRGGFDDFDEIENYQSFQNQKLQNFSNSKYSNTSIGIKVSNNTNIANTNKQSAPQSKSKIAKKLERNIEQTREPLKSTNKQTNSKKKNQEVKLYGSIIQKVDYPQKKTQIENKPASTNLLDQSPKVEREPGISKSPSLKSCMKANITNTDNKYDKSNINKSNKNNKNKISNDVNNKNNDEDNLQVLATKYSKFLQERINSHQHCEIQPVQYEKPQKTVSFQEPTTFNNSNQIQKSDDSKRPKLHQSATQFVERPEVDPCQKKYNQKQSLDIKPNRKDQIKKESRSINVSNTRKINKNLNVTPQKRRKSDFDSYSETESGTDSIDDFHYIEPKVPPKPIEHSDITKDVKALDSNDSAINENNEINDKSDDKFKELIRRKNELDARINDAIEYQKKQENELDNHFQIKQSQETIGFKTTDDTDSFTYDSLVPRIEQIKSSLLDSNKDSSKQTQSSLSKEPSSKSDSENTDTNDNIISNCIQLDPSSFVPKKRLFDMSDSDSDSDFESDLKSNLKSEVNIEEKPKNQLLLQCNNSKNKNEPQSPHVTWDISNCPPIRPKISNNFSINKSFSFINYDEMNGYTEDKDTNLNEINYDSNQIDFNSPINFSKAMKLPKNFLNDLNTDFYNENDNNLLTDNYDNEEEDSSETVPNYSRILSILNKKLDESQYNEVVNIMNNYKVKHFCLLISMPNQNIEALYLLRSDLKYAKILWGEGLTNVFIEDVEKFFSINIASRKFELMKTSEFACDVDAFTIN